MNLRIPLLVGTCILLSAAPGCGKSSVKVSSGPKGLAAVPPAMAAAVRKAAACKSFEVGFDSTCADYKAWEDQKDDFNEGKADGSLVSLLEDDSEKVRFLGARKLNQYGKTFQTDKPLATRVVAAAEAEKTKFAAYEIGSVAGHVKVGPTGLFDRTAAIVKKHAVPDMRRGVLANLLFWNQDSDPVFNLVRDSVKDADKAVAMQALTSFWTGGSRRAADTCALYAANVTNTNDDLAAEASNALSWYRQCSSKYDLLLDSLAKREKADKMPNASFAYALRHVCEPESKGSEAQKKRAEEIAKKVVESKPIPGYVRAVALDAAVTCDPKGAKKLLKKAEKDADAAVKQKAGELLAKK